jgi:hypothetical protein
MSPRLSQDRGKAAARIRLLKEANRCRALAMSSPPRLAKELEDEAERLEGAARA